MLIATVTVVGVCWVVFLVIALLGACMLFSHAVGSGTFFGWWMANSIMDLIGLIFQAIIEALASMRD